MAKVSASHVGLAVARATTWAETQNRVNRPGFRDCLVVRVTAS
jgi:hypothetical protein